jgi:hypothetical protein
MKGMAKELALLQIFLKNVCSPFEAYFFHAGALMRSNCCFKMEHAPISLLF